MTTLDAAHRAIDDVALEFGRLAAVQGEHDRRNGTNRHDYGAQAEQAAATARRARRKGKLTWRHVLAEQYWAVLTQTDNGQLRRALISLAAHALLWAATIDRRHQDTAAPASSGATSPAPEHLHAGESTEP